MFSLTSTALIPYTPPQSPMEFIRSEWEKSQKRTITQKHIQNILLREYGTRGYETIGKMADALKAYHFSLTYNVTTRTFTILNSFGVDKEEIEKIFAQRSYTGPGYQPQVLDEVNSSRNRLVKLVFRDVELTTEDVYPSWERRPESVIVTASADSRAGVYSVYSSSRMLTFQASNLKA